MLSSSRRVLERMREAAVGAGAAPALPKSIHRCLPGRGGAGGCRSGCGGEDGLHLRAQFLSPLEEIPLLSDVLERGSRPSPAPGASCIFTSLIFLTGSPSSECVRLLSPLLVVNISSDFFAFPRTRLLLRKVFLVSNKLLVIPFKQWASLCRPSMLKFLCRSQAGFSWPRAAAVAEGA